MALLDSSGVARLWRRVTGYVAEYVSAYVASSIATASSRGQVRPDGTTITVDPDGTIHGVVQETDPTVPSWAKQPAKPTYTAQEVGALPDSTFIPANMGDLTNDNGYITANDLPSWVRQPDKPTYTASEVGALPEDTAIPAFTSELSNDSGYLTASDVPEWAMRYSKPEYTASEVGALPDSTQVPYYTSQLENDSGFLDASSPLDAGNIYGTISSENLPSYVDDVVEGYLHQGTFYSDQSHTEAMDAETGKIYVDLSDDASYRWSGSTYIPIGNPIDFATQAEAEAGSNDSKAMTPLRTAQAIAALVDVPEQVQADWDEDDATSEAYVANRPMHRHLDRYEVLPRSTHMGDTGGDAYVRPYGSMGYHYLIPDMEREVDLDDVARDDMRIGGPSGWIDAELRGAGSLEASPAASERLGEVVGWLWFGYTGYRRVVYAFGERGGRGYVNVFAESGSTVGALCGLSVYGYVYDRLDGRYIDWGACDPSEIGALPDTTSVGDLPNDAGYVTASDVERMLAPLLSELASLRSRVAALEAGVPGGASYDEGTFASSGSYEDGTLVVSATYDSGTLAFGGAQPAGYVSYSDGTLRGGTYGDGTLVTGLSYSEGTMS